VGTGVPGGGGGGVPGTGGAGGAGGALTPAAADSGWLTGVPQSEQNAFPSGTSFPQLLQNIEPP
jgi:hypothetical protein